jgi:PAS domain S-box-containing protein
MKTFIKYTKSQIIDTAITIYALVVLFPLCFSLLRVYQIGWQTVHFFHIGGALILLSIFLLRHKMSTELKAHIFAVFTILIGMLAVFSYGQNGGYHMSFLGILLAAMVLEKRYAFLYIGITIITMVIIAMGYSVGTFRLKIDLNEYQYNWINWTDRIVSIASVLVIITLAIQKLFENLSNLALRSSENNNKLQALFNQTHSFIWMLDGHGKVMEANQVALFYVDKKLEDVEGLYFADTPWWNTNNKETSSIIVKSLAASIGGDFKRFEAVLRNREGVFEYFDFTLKPIFDDQANIILIIAEGRDISKMKHAEQALIESEERLLTFTEATYEGLVIIDENLIVDANNSILKMFGYDKLSNVIGHQLVYDFIAPSDHLKIFQYAAGNLVGPVEVNGIRPDGTTFPIEIQARQILYKGMPHLVASIRDLSERHHAQKALIESEEKYRLIAENINDIIWKIDKEFNFSYVSSSIYPMLGYTVEEAMNFSLKKFFTEADYGKLQDIVKNKFILAGNDDSNAWDMESIEAILERKDGNRIWTQISIKLIPPTSGSSIDTLGVIRNINVLKTTQITLEDNELRLKQQNEEYEVLNEELKKLNKKLVLAKEKAEESDKLKSSFLANMSHEIRTPMNSIIGFSKMCVKDNLEDEKRRKYASYVVENGEQLLTIVNDILDLSKIEAGQVKIKPELFNLNLLMENLYHNFQHQNNKGLLLLMQKGILDENAMIYSDKTRLNQILSNLLNNALKFTLKGHIKFGYNVIDKQILFYVEDTGIGIPVEHHTKIFERFRQADLETTRLFGGTGLGLSICKRLIELMNGKIWVQSEPNKGSVFYFTLPFEMNMHDGFEEVKVVHKGEHRDMDKRPLILIAEDEESNFIYLNEILAEKKFRILWAKDGKEAFEYCLTNKEICLVLMDIKMPGMDGFSATTLIKKQFPDMPVIAQTAFAMQSDKETALASGCDDYLSKPIDPEQLLLKIKQHLLIP